MEDEMGETGFEDDEDITYIVCVKH